MLALPAAAVLSWAAATLLCGCGQEQKRYVPNAVDGMTTPTMTTTDVSTLISDSGYTRYHLTAPVWLMFEDAEEPFWRFPGGLELQQYDLEMQPSANVVCDSAIYYSRKRVWQLDGNVVMVNTEADSFLTQQLFWDQNSRKIYSDSFIHIVRTDRIIEGYGFTSNENMTAYTVNRPTGIIPVERREQSEAAPDTAAAADTLAPPAPTRRAPERASQRAARPVQPAAGAADPTTVMKTNTSR